MPSHLATTKRQSRCLDDIQAGALTDHEVSDRRSSKEQSTSCAPDKTHTQEGVCGVGGSVALMIVLVFL